MAVSVNGASGVAVGDGYNTTLTASLTVAAGSQRLLVAFTNGACTGVTYGGTAMTMSDSRSGIASALDTKCWTLADPTVGTANLVATRASDGPMMLTGRCVNGYNSGAGFSFAHYTLTFRNSPQSLAASIPAGGMGLSYIVDNSQSTLGYTAGAGSTKDAEFTAASYYAYAVESIPGAASAAEWSWASGQRGIAHHVIVISGDVVAPTITGPSGAAGAGTSTANIAENATTGPTFSTDIALGGGYPTLTGAQAANWSITALTATSWRADPVTPFDFEAGGLVNPQTVVFNASASVAQTCTITIVNMPEFSGTVPAQSGITGTSFSLDLSPYFGTGSFTYAIASGSLTGSGLSLNTSSGVISGTLGTVAVYTVTVSAAGAIGSAVNTNSFAITVSSTGTAPTVSTHPSNTTVTAGATASFTAAAGGSPTPTVQWQENTGSWSNISGQTTTTLSLGIVGTPDNGRQFRAVFTNSSGSATTNTATLTVNAAAGDGTITSEPLKNNMGQLLGAATLSWVGFRNASTGADVLLLTSVAVNSSSIFTTGTNAALAPGQLYAINWKTSDGKYGYAWANAV